MLVIKRILLAAVLAAVLTGCYDNFDLEERALCTAIAIDYSEDNGYSIILSVPALEKENELKRGLKTQTAPTIREAAELIDSKSSKKLYYGHTRAVILGMGLLRNEHAIEELTQYLKNNVQIDKNILLSASYDINRIMELDPGEDKLTGFYISGFYEGGKEEKTFVNKENLLSLLKERAENRPAAIPLISVSDNSPHFGGIVLLKGNTLKGVLEENEAEGFMWLCDRDYGGTLTAGTPPVSAEITEKKTSYEIIEKDGKKRLLITIDAVGNMWNYTDDEIKSKASDYLGFFRDKIYSQTRLALKKLSETDCEIFGPEGSESVDVKVNLSLNFV